MKTGGTLKKMRSKETEGLPLLPRARFAANPYGRGMEKSNPGGLSRSCRWRVEPAFIEQYNLPEYDADILTSERKLSDYFENTVQAYGGDPKKVSNWLMNDVAAHDQRPGSEPEEMKLTPLPWRKSLSGNKARSTSTPAKGCCRRFRTAESHRIRSLPMKDWGWSR
jgi:hypothetical protein